MLPQLTRLPSDDDRMSVVDINLRRVRVNTALPGEGCVHRRGGGDGIATPRQGCMPAVNL